MMQGPAPTHLPPRPNSISAYFYNTVWLLADRGYAIVLGLFVSIFVARYLGREGVGLLGFAVSVATIVRATATLGLNEILVREIVSNESKRNSLLGTAACLRLLGSLIAIMLSVVIALITRPGDTISRNLIIIISVSHLFEAGLVINQWNTARVQARFNVIAANIALTITGAIKLALVYFTMPIYYFAISNVILAAIKVSFLLFLYSQQSTETILKWRFETSVASSLMKDAWPRIPAILTTAFQTHFGVILVGSLFTDAVLGDYSLALRFFLLFNFLPNVICQTLAPRLTEAHRAGANQFGKVMTQTYSLILLCYFLAAIVMVGLAFWGIPILYGDEFEQAGIFLLPFLFPMFLSFVGAVRLWFIVNENMFLYSMWLSFLMFIVSITANLLLIPHFGVLGAVISICCPIVVVYSVDFLFPPARQNWRYIVNGFKPKAVITVLKSVLD